MMAETSAVLADMFQFVRSAEMLIFALIRAQLRRRHVVRRSIRDEAPLPAPN